MEQRAAPDPGQGTQASPQHGGTRVMGGAQFPLVCTRSHGWWSLTRFDCSVRCVCPRNVRWCTSIRAFTSTFAIGSNVTRTSRLRARPVVKARVLLG